MSEPSSPQRFAPIALWRVASRLLITLFGLFGEPQELAFRHTIVRRDYKLMCNWLRTVEALFRQLLVIEASHYAHEATTAKPRAAAKRQRREMTFADQNPDAWRVSFCTVMARAHENGSARLRRACGAERCAPTGPPPAPYLAPTTFHSAWPLAERFEALLRVHNDPAPYAKRLARRLYANPASVDSIILEPPELQHRIDPEPHASIAALVRERAPTFKHDSS